MKTGTAFDIGLQDYSVTRLLLEDIGAIQGLFKLCEDYMLLVDGHPADPDVVEQEFRSVPPGRSYADKFVFGIIDRQNELVGLLDTLRWYPDETSWWIDTLLFVPGSRSRGLGRLVVQAFAKYAQAAGARAIMLGVVEENERALGFWTGMGFELLRRREPQQFGNKMQTVCIMRRILMVS